MRISDWSSDVCSSDLRRRWRARPTAPRATATRRAGSCAEPVLPAPPGGESLDAIVGHLAGVLRDRRAHRGHADAQDRGGCAFDRERSEEHTYELQSLMRISYAGVCLKKTINNINTQIN